MRKSVAISAFLLILVLLTFAPRLLSLSEHWATDESKWMLRSLVFFSALKTGQFTDTYITPHPGVTTCWLGSIAIWNTYRHDSSQESSLDLDKFYSPEMLAQVRLPIAVMTGVLVLLAGFLLYRLFGDRLIAGLGTLFLAIEPFLLSESRRAHTDALMSLFLFLSLLLWLCYLESETPRRRDIILSGVCFTFACLTKSLAGGFLLFLPLLLGWYFKQRGISWEKLIWSAFLWVISAFLTVLVAWPYMWTLMFNPLNLPIFPALLVATGALLIWCCRKLSTDTSTALTQTERSVLGGGLLMIVVSVLAALEPITKEMFKVTKHANVIPTLFLGEIRYDPGVVYFPVMWLVWSAPLALPLIGTAIYRAWQQRDHAKKAFRVVVVLAVFALFYFVGLSFVSKKISRYIVVLLPVVSLLTTLGAVEAAKLFKKRQAGFLFVVVIVLLQIAPILRLHPYYRTYYHPLLSGKWVAANTSSITGAGLDLAADYLNARPNAQDLQVYLKSIFTQDLTHYLVGQTGDIRDTSVDFDYAVEHLYDRQIQGIPIDPYPKADDQPSEQQPIQELSHQLGRTIELEHVVRINGIDYVWIYRVLSEETQKL